MADNILDTEDNPNRDYLAELVGPSGKYKDEKELGKAYYHADTHIKTLERKIDDLTADYLKVSEDNQKRATLEEVVRRLEERSKTNSETPLGESKTEKPILDLTEIDKRVAQQVQAIDLDRRQTENANLVRSKLKERYGDNFSAAVKQQITDLGITEEEFNALARRTPSLILKTLGADETPRDTFQSPPRNSNMFAPKGAQKKTWSYWQTLKKENPKMYLDPQITNEMTQAAVELGDAFYDGDWERPERLRYTRQ